MNKSKGFSLIELMIVVAIIGVVTAIAYPSYQEYARSAKRAEAKGVVLEMAQWMERYYTINGKYTDASDAMPSLPITTAPKDGNEVYYNLGVTGTSTSFIISAVPAGAQAADSCGTLAVSQTGSTTAAGGGDCW